MDAGAEDATILALRVDDEPAFAAPARLTRATRFTDGRRLLRWRWSAPLLAVCACGSLLAIAWAPFDAGAKRVETRDIERTVGSELSGQLLGDLRVDRVRCVLRTETNARCRAELFDKGGDGPIVQGVTVSIEPSSGEYSLQPGPAHPARGAR